MTAHFTERQLALLTQPPSRRKPALEVKTHIALADLLRARTEPGWWWSHIGHGEKRSATTGALLKRMGLKRGIPDFVFVSPVGKHCWLELKRGRAPLTDAQEAFADMCFERGISHRVARSFEEAVDVLRGWGVLP